jgi:hypothetical protein
MENMDLHHMLMFDKPFTPLVAIRANVPMHRKISHFLKIEAKNSFYINNIHII